MAKSDSILAIDIGSDSLKVAEFSNAADRVLLDKFAYTEYNTDDGDGTVQLAVELKKLLANNDFNSKKVHLSVSGQSAFVRFVKLPPVGSDPAKVKQIVEFEAKQNVPFPMDEVVWDYQLISSEDDTEIDAVFIVIKNEEIVKVTDLLEECGLDVSLIEISPTASYNSAVANEIGHDECSMLLNIGSKCSTLTFIDHGRFFVRTIPIAGQTITQQIAKEFGIPFSDAEEMKRRHGFVALGGAYEEPDSEVAATVSKIVRNVMTRLHGEINRSINVYRSQQKGKRPMKLFLSGGSSVMAFTPRFFSEKLRMPVDYFNPFKAIKLGDGVDKEKLAEIAHMFSDIIGLGLRNNTICPVEVSLMPEELTKQNELKNKIPYFYASAVSLLLCLGIVFWGVGHQQGLEELYVDSSGDAINRTKAFVSKIESINKKTKAVQKKYDAVTGVLSERGKWTRIVNEIQSLLPEDAWLTSVGVASNTEEVELAPKKGLFGSTSKKKFGAKSKSSEKVIEWVEVSGYTLNRRDLDALDKKLNQRKLKAEKAGVKPIFAGGETTGGAETLETSIVTMNNLKVQKYKIRLKLSEPIK